MLKISIKITVLFSDPFWQMLVERTNSELYEVSRVVFGSEPKDYEIYAYLSANYAHLSFSSQSETAPLNERRINPKREKRLIAKELKERSPSTKAQAALSAAREQQKTANKQQRREKHALLKEQQFHLRTQKRKAKHKGH